VTWIASPDTEAIIPLTQALPLGAADGVDGDVAELVLPAAVEGWAVFDVVWDAPHAATESAVAPVSVRSANRVSRADGEVTDIEILSIVGRCAQAGYASNLTISGAAERWLASDYEPAVYCGSLREYAARTPLRAAP
jgi:hypothetical protein